jgi:stage III sporulation protein AA
MLGFLPSTVRESIRLLNAQKLYEIRLRAGKPVTVNFAGEYRYLGAYGLTDFAEKALYCDMQDLADCVFRAGKYSVYAVEEQIKSGFITAENGERIGIAGEYVFEKGQPLTIRNFTSLCIRVPHEIIGCGVEIYQRCLQDKMRSVLIVSSPGLGKTTILRDLSRIISEKTRRNILICDERGEISAGNTGSSCDVLRFSDKKNAFEAGIRAMRPDMMITDELSIDDCKAVERAVLAGICVLASAHFKEFSNIKDVFLGLFERFVVLDEREIGKIKCIYDNKGRVLI